MEIINKIKFENNCWVGEISPTFNLSEQNRFQVSNIGAISKGSFESKNCEVRFNHFLTESGGSPSVPLEFVPVRFKDIPQLISTNLAFYSDLHSKLLRYCYIGYVTKNKIKTLYHFTNLRTLLNAGFDLNEIPFNTLEEVKDFKIIVGRIPFKVYSHLHKHRSLNPFDESEMNDYEFSAISETSRSKNYKPEFWRPKHDSWVSMPFIDDKRVQEVDELVKSCIKPEIANMEYSQRRLVYFAICGWRNDPTTFDNLFKVREGKDTMDITSIVVNNIKKLVEISL